MIRGCCHRITSHLVPKGLPAWSEIKRALLYSGIVWTEVVNTDSLANALRFAITTRIRNQPQISTPARTFFPP